MCVCVCVLVLLPRGDEATVGFIALGPWQKTQPLVLLQGRVKEPFVALLPVTKPIVLGSLLEQCMLLAQCLL